MPSPFASLPSGITLAHASAASIVPLSCRLGSFVFADNVIRLRSSLISVLRMSQLTYARRISLFLHNLMEVPCEQLLQMLLLLTLTHVEIPIGTANVYGGRA